MTCDAFERSIFQFFCDSYTVVDGYALLQRSVQGFGVPVERVVKGGEEEIVVGNNGRKTLLWYLKTIS